MQVPRNHKAFYLAVAGLVVVACASGCASNKTTPPPPIDSYESSALNAMEHRLPAAAETSLQAALRRYQAADDIDGQWRVHTYLARLYLAEAQTAAAAEQAAAMEGLAAELDSRSAWYQTYLLLGQTRDPRYFERARPYSATPLQEAVVLTYMGETAKALATLEGQGEDYPADRAFIHYRYGATHGDAASVHRALAYYKQAGDSRGIADSLLWLAQDAQREGDTALARRYGSRAERVLEASGDARRAGQVAAWLGELP